MEQDELQANVDQYLSQLKVRHKHKNLAEARAARLQKALETPPDNPYQQKPKLHELGSLSLGSWITKYYCQNTRCGRCQRVARPHRKLAWKPWLSTKLICSRCITFFQLLHRVID